jgi:hypothetical protein
LAESQRTTLAELSDQIAALQTAVAARQRDDVEREDEASEREAAHREALKALGRAQASLAMGGSDVEADLDQAKLTLNTTAGEAISRAEQSLDNGDLYSARLHIQEALTADNSGAETAGPSAMSGHRSGRGR